MEAQEDLYIVKDPAGREFVTKGDLTIDGPLSPMQVIAISHFRLGQAIDDVATVLSGIRDALERAADRD